MKVYNPKLSNEVLTKCVEVRQSAEFRGYAEIPASILDGAPSRLYFDDFLRSLEQIPVDPYDKAVARRRYITYGQYYKPNDLGDTLLYFVKPPYDAGEGKRLFPYQLPAHVNPEHADERKFAPVPDDAIASVFMHELIEAGYHLVPLASKFRSKPLQVEIQFIRYEPRRGIPALGTPPTTHQDNDWAFCVLLLERSNVEGPENAFVSLKHTNQKLKDVPEDAILNRLTLVGPLEGYCCDDTKVAHYVGPTRLRGEAETGRRTIVILSFKPLVPLGPEDVRLADELARISRDRPGMIAEPTGAPSSIELPTTVKRPRRRGAGEGGAIPEDKDTTTFYHSY